MTIMDLYNNFITDCKLRRLSPKSIIDYKGFLEPFIRFVGENLPLSRLDNGLVQDYCLYQAERPLSIATYATYLRHLKAFLNFGVREYDLQLDIKKIKIPKTPKKNPPLYNAEQIRMIFRQISTSEEWLTVRNKSMISLMLDSGLRQNEVVNLLWKNINFEQGYIRILGKGNKERIVPLGNFSSQFLKEYRTLCPYAEQGNVFLGRYGEVVNCDMLKHMVYRLNKQLPFHVTSHLFRHNFATNWCIDQYHKYGHMDSYSLMVLLGHEDTKTTERYLHHAKSLLAAQNSISHLDAVFSIS